MRRDELLDAIGARINHYTSTGQVWSITDPAAEREAQELLALVPDVSRDIDVCYVVGGLYWCRWAELGGGQPTADFNRTIDLMVHVYRERPEQVPKMLAELFDHTGHTTGALRAGASANEGDRLFAEYQRTGDRSALDRAVALRREAAHLSDPTPERRRYNAMGFALALHTVVQLDPDPAVVDELVECLHHALSAHPEEPAEFLGLLVSALTHRFAATRDPHDIDEAVSVGTRLAETSREALLLGPVCTACGLWLQDNRDPARTRQVADLALACLASVPRTEPLRVHHLRAVVTGLLAVTDQVPDLLDPAIDLLREFVATPGTDPLNARQGLLAALRERYEAQGAPHDLDEAVTLGRQVMDALPPDHPDRWPAVDEFATYLGKRFRSTDRLDDIAEAISLGRQVVAASPQPRHVNNLGAWLVDRYQVTHDLSDLDEAVDLLRRAVAASPTDAGVIRNLAVALELKYHRTGEFAALDESRHLHRRAAGLS